MSEQAVATYDFAGTGALSGDWTTQLNTLSRANGHGNGSTSSRNSTADWTGDSFDNDQYSFAECYGLSSYTRYVLVNVRGATGWDAYVGTTDGVAGTPEHCGILEYNSVGDSGDGVFVTDINQDFNDTDLIKIVVEGTSISMYRSTDGGASWGSPVSSTTDATLTAGDAGAGVWGSGEGIDNWEGGNIVSGIALLRRRIEGC